MAENGSNATVIPIEVAAQLVMVSAERVRQLIKAGYVQRASHGHVTLVSAVQGYIRSLQESHERALSKQPAKNGVAEARQREIELRTAERAKRLMNVDEMFEALDELVGSVRTEFAGLPASMTRDISERREIETKLNGALKRIAERFAKKSRDLRPYRVADGTDAPAIPRRVGRGKQNLPSDVGRPRTSGSNADSVHDTVRKGGNGRRVGARDHGVLGSDRKN